MKRHVQQPGIRKWSGDDLLELQSEPLTVLDHFFGQYGDMVVKGCVIDAEAGTISAGLIAISGKDVDGKDTYKVCPFRGAAGVNVFPVYLALKSTEITRDYEDTVVRPIAYQYEAELLAVKPTDRPYIELSDNSKVQFIDVIQDDLHTFISNKERHSWDNKANSNHSHSIADEEHAGFLSAEDYNKIQAQTGINKTMAAAIGALDDKIRIPTLNNEPTEDTLNYQYKEKTCTFSIGQQCRVFDVENQQYVFYQLYDITAENKADWKIAGSGGDVQLTENASISLSSNQAQPDTALFGAIIRVIYGESDISLTWQGEALSIEIPVNMTYRVKFPKVAGYATPSEVEYVAEMGNTRPINAIYNTTMMTIDIACNQADKTDLNNLQISVSGSISKEFAYDGQPLSLKVPLGEQVVITPAQVTGYAAVPPITKTPNAATDTVTFAYNTTILTIDVTSNQVDKTDLNNLQISVSGSISKELTYEGQPLSLKVPLGEQVVITPAQVTGYAAVPPITKTPNAATDTVTFAYNTTILTIDVTSNQVDKADLNNLQITVSGSVNKRLTYDGQPFSLKVPLGAQVVITPAQVTGYAAVPPITKTPSAATDTVTFTYNTTITYISLISNQGIDDALNDIKITVKYGDIIKNITWQGSALSVRIPTGCSYLVSSGSITGYNTPAEKSQTATGTTGSVSLTYTTEKLTINVTADDGGSVVTQTLTVTNTANSAVLYSGNAGVGVIVKIPFQTSYKVSVNDFALYFKPDDQIFNASIANRTVPVVYKKIKSSQITFDKSISDPSNISGDINTGVIKDILAKFRRCLCKKTANGEVAIAYLKNDNSTYYEDGTVAQLNGSEGDVMVYKPEFYYKYESLGGTKFAYRLSFFDADGTYKHSPESLIGAYKCYCTSNKMYSRSGVTPTANQSTDTFDTWAKARGTGYQRIDYEQHCMIALMFYAKYGNRSSQAVLGEGGAMDNNNNRTGSTNSRGNTDTQNETVNYVNFLGIEGVHGCLSEWVSGVVINNYVWTITNPDGTIRTVTALSSGGWIVEVAAAAGPFFDLVPIQTNGSESSYYSDYIYSSYTGLRVLARSSYSAGTYGGVSFTNASNGSSNAHEVCGCRLAFRGIVRPAQSVSVFKSLQVL